MPNDALETKIGIYTPEIAQSILMEYPDIVEHWLQKLHAEYISNKKSCDLENDPVACFTLSVYEQFEKHFKSWEGGGLVAITLPRGRVIRISKQPLISVVSNSSHLVCTKCLASFPTLAELERHSKEEAAAPLQKEITQAPYGNVAPNPTWRVAQ